MSTFDGFVEEFPLISIDYFRKNPHRDAPQACFLSHAHSDHLQGLESFRSPFIYCSAATKELLLRIEKYPHRMNFNNGILESRRLHYKHLSKLLRPIPLNTPTEIELTLKQSIRVTLFDANHCTGAVMFLIEGDGRAILYTGDIRSESWWVNGLIRHPVLIPYTLGNKRLDKVYLDTTFARNSHTFDVFPTKAEGVAELLRKLEPYPENTTFYFRAWTFGYEEVWVALAAALRSKIHVDRYQIGLYKAVSSASGEGSGAGAAPSLCGFELGNETIPGCLGEDEKSRIHSCEPGVHCPAATSSKTVYITPIVSRTDRGSDIPEVGAGGGLGDLYQIHELELPDQLALDRLEQLCSEKIQDPDALTKAKEALSKAFKSRSKTLSLDSYGMNDAHKLPLDELVNALSRGEVSEDTISPVALGSSTDILDKSGKPLSRTIRFPYSRHSSYAELCELVAAFKPRDIHPCTIDPLEWDEAISMQSLFGHLCSDNKFVHDQIMRDMVATETGEPPRKRTRHDPDSSTQSTQQSTAPTYDETVSQISQVSIQAIAEASHAPLPRQAEPSSPALQSSATTPTPMPQPSLQPQEPEQTEETTTAKSTSADSFNIPPLSPRSAKERRNAIRHARRLLQDAQNQQFEDNQVQFQLGPLPDSWPSNEEGSQVSLSLATAQAQAQGQNVEEIEEGVSQVTTVHDPDPQLPEILPTDTDAGETSAFEELCLAAGIRMQIDADLEANANANVDTETNTQHNLSQQSHALTLSSSAFASQSQSQSQSQDQLAGLDSHDHEQLQDFASLVGEDYITEDQHEDVQARPPHFPRRESSIRNRQAAYEAAREDSYDAWAEMGLTSAGNNHTVEEEEL
ncbi:hypothetical protein BDV06DRAFT_192197 [Aspergillus oleicola]